MANLQKIEKSKRAIKRARLERARLLSNLAAAEISREVVRLQSLNRASHRADRGDPLVTDVNPAVAHFDLEVAELLLRGVHVDDMTFECSGRD
ncbi:MAG TPA: hypothetical protein VEB21_17660, partial [Terriglobales bacterium]|nr:hypothetical protein [Terriglobales bacterium]